MKSKLFLFIVCLNLSLYSCKKQQINLKPNILLICIDDLRPELRAFGANHIISPNIDQLASNGVLFKKHFVNAPSCGPSRYTLLTGQYGPASNSALFIRSKKISKSSEFVKPSMPEWFKTYGYTTVSVGKVSHHPGGRGGKDWNDSTIIEMPRAWDKHLMPVAEWTSPRGAMHGLAHGETRLKASDMDVFQAANGDDSIYPDGKITDEAIKQLRGLTRNNEKPFFLAVGIIKPHLPFGAPKSYLDLYNNVEFPPINHPQKPNSKTTWHGSNEFMKYNRWGKNPNEDEAFAEEIRRHYAACVTYADAQVGKILNELKQSGADKNTIVVLWGDHGWHLGEHAIWGKHSLFEESLLSPLIISTPSLKENQKSTQINAVVETLDVFPTLCDLAGVEVPEFSQGISLKGLLKNPDTITNSMAFAYTNKAKTIRTETHRLIVHKDSFIELYDHTKDRKETQNIADTNLELVDELKAILNSKLN